MTRLRRMLHAAAGAALFAFAGALAAGAATVHPVAHPVSHAADAKAHATAVHGKAKAEPVSSHATKSRGKDVAVPVRSAGRKADSSRALKPATQATAKGAKGKRRVDVEDDAPVAKGHAKAGANAKSSKPARPGARSKAKPTEAPARPAMKGSAKSRHSKHQDEDADNDPPVVYRASAAKPTSKAPVTDAVRTASRPAERDAEADATEVGSAFPDGQVKGHHERRPGPAATAVKHGGATPAPAAAGSGTTANQSGDATRTQATNEDFLRAAGIARVDGPATTAKSDTFARGESHPDEDVRVDMHVPAPVRRMPAQPSTAIVTAAPVAAVAPTLLRTKKTTKVNIMPDDLAGKDALIEVAMTPMVLPNLYSGGRLVVPPPMKGSHDILVHQNTMADADGLSRIQDDEDLNNMRAAHLLVPIAESDALEVNSELPMNRRYARPWTARFVQDTARAYYARFHDPLRLSSAVRTVAYQLRLQRVNGNAAAVDGDAASPHLTGQAIDFGKHGMTMAEIAWMRAYLGPIMDAGKIDVEEEFQQACFHISVYKAYVPAPVRKARVMEVAQVHQAPIVRRAPKVEKNDADGPDASPENDSQQ